MKALLTCVAVAAVTAASLLMSSGSSFESVSQEQAATITGGACWTTKASGCRQVIGLTPFGNPIIGDAEGCGTQQGTVIDKEKDTGETPYGFIKWCSSDKSWKCGAVITERFRCARPIGGTLN